MIFAVGAAFLWFHVLDPLHEMLHWAVGNIAGGDVRPGCRLPKLVTGVRLPSLAQ